MKNQLVLIVVLFFTGCSGNIYMPAGGTINEQFVGTWVGKDVEGLVTREWTQIRKSNGTYKITMVITQKDEVDQSIERGYWWLKDDMFFEINPDAMSEPDVYKFELMNEKEIRFINVSFDMSADIYRENYSFIDRRK